MKNYKGKIYIGIDNGVTGSIGIISNSKKFIQFFPTPVFKEFNYTKKKRKISRLDHNKLKAIFNDVCIGFRGYMFFVCIERPMVNPGRFQASVSALRCLEAELIVVYDFEFPYQYIDSKHWQRDMLPKGLKGTKDLKKASKDIGIRLFPQFEKDIRKQKDADGLLIAEWARRRNL